MEVEYRGYDPLEALRVIQERQIQEFTQFRKLLRQLKFELKTEDYFAWKRCLKEYDLAKRNFIKTARRMKLSFQGQLKSLMARNLAADQYQMELQNLLQQFQTEFTPSVESFHTNIKNLFETIRDEKRRKKWWSTVKTTEITTGPDGTQTRTSLTQTSSGIGGQQTGYSKSSESNSIAGGLLGGSSSVEYKTSSKDKTKIGTVGGGSGGYVASGSQSESSTRDIDEDNDSDDKDSGSSKYSVSQESKTGDYGASSSKESSQESKTGDYGASSSEESSQVSKESKYSAKGAKSAGSFVDNNQINFSQVQTRTGLKEGYGTSQSSKEGYGTSQSSKEEGVVKKSGYTATSGGYRRRRRTLGLLAGALGAKRSALNGGGGGEYGGNGGGGYGGNGGGAGVGVGVNVGVGLGAGGGGGGSGAGVGASARVGFGGGGGAQNYGGKGGGFKAGSNFEGGSPGFQGGSPGFQGGSSGVQRGSFKGESGFEGESGGFQSGSSGFQGDASKYSKSMSGENSIDGNYNSRSSLSGDYNLENNFQGGKVSKAVKKEKKYQETQMSMSDGPSGYGY